MNALTLRRDAFRLSLFGKGAFALCLTAFLFAGAGWNGAAAQDPGPVFVGSAACASCHEEQYSRFSSTSKKARSWEGVRKMLPKLTPAEQQECFACHTTGYGKPGGFVNYETTPGLADVGCETCHGPGSVHAESGEPSAIQRKPRLEQCTDCHNAQRIQNFNFKPLIYSGAH